jgi:hypothetical protein
LISTVPLGVAFAFPAGGSGGSGPVVVGPVVLGPVVVRVVVVVIGFGPVVVGVVAAEVISASITVMMSSPPFRAAPPVNPAAASCW